MKRDQTGSYIAKMGPVKIIDECIQFARRHVTDIVPSTKALYDNAIAQGWRGPNYEEVCLSFGYRNGLVVAHGRPVAHYGRNVDATALARR